MNEDIKTLVQVIKAGATRESFDLDVIEAATSSIIADDSFEQLPTSVKDSVYFLDMHDIERPSREDILRSGEVLYKYLDSSQRKSRLLPYIEEYEEWVDKNIPIEDGWIDEVNMLSFLRDELQYEVDSSPIDSESQARIDDIDARWIAKIKSNIDPEFRYTDKPSTRTDSDLWWWNIDNL